MTTNTRTDKGWRARMTKYCISYLEQHGYTILQPQVEESEDFEKFWQAYDKKCSKNKTKKLWSKLSKADRKAALDYCEPYKEAQPDKQYRKNPDTFLRNRSWEDELITTKMATPITPSQQQPSISTLIEQRTPTILSEEERGKNYLQRIRDMIAIADHNMSVRKTLINMYNNGTLQSLGLNWAP